MTTSTEDLLRQALQRQAERAPDPDRVRAALPSRAARRTRRRYGTLVGGLVAAAALTAVAVPVLALDDAGTPRGSGFGGPGSPSASASGPVTPSVPSAVNLRYKPTWLPSGLTERSRTVPLGRDFGYDGPVRIWKRANAGGGFDMGGTRLEFAAVAAEDGRDQFGDDGQAVDINGRPGRLSGGSGGSKTSLHWMIDPQTVIFIHNVEAGVSDSDLLRIARSVQPDAGQVPVPLRFGWLPTGMETKSAQFAGESTDRWQLEVTAYGRKPGQPDASQAPTSEKEKTESPDRGLYARLGRTTDAPDGGDATTVGGRPARVVVRPIDGPAPFEHAYVVVELASGLKLTVFGLLPDVTREDLLKTAAAIEIGTIPDLTWLGAATR